MPSLCCFTNDAINGTARAGDFTGSGTIFSPGVRSRSGSRLHLTRETRESRTMVDTKRSGRTAESMSADASFAAVCCRRAIYGDTLGFDSFALLDALRKFWMDRFREGYPVPSRLLAEEDEQAPAARETACPSPDPLDALEAIRLQYPKRDPLERKQRPERQEGVQARTAARRSG
jgi:hypothetical protein